MRPMKVNIQDGCWRIIEWPLKAGECHVLQHRCVKNQSTGDWHDRVYHPDHRGWACPWCEAFPPEGIQGAFLFLKDEEYKSFG